MDWISSDDGTQMLDEARRDYGAGFKQVPPEATSFRITRPIISISPTLIILFSHGSQHTYLIVGWLYPQHEDASFFNIIDFSA